jgi:hypothetical protein
LAAALSSIVELIEDRIDITTTNWVRWHTRSALVVTLSHILELRT